MKKLIAIVGWMCFITTANACETKRQVFIENSQTKVWRTTICPHQSVPYHTHQYARVVIPAENGTLKAVYKSGKIDFIHLKKDIPVLLDKAQGEALHKDINTGNKVLHVTVIELR